jgi:hypothetical protein
VIYLDETAEEKDVVKALNSGARWLVLAPTIRPQVQEFGMYMMYMVFSDIDSLNQCVSKPV